MKKKNIVIVVIIIIIVIILALLCLVFINKKEKDYSTVILDKTTYRLTQNENELGIHYKVAHNFRKGNLFRYISYHSEGVDGSPYFLIKIYRFRDKTLNEAIKETVGKSDKTKKIKIHDLDYTVVQSKDILNRDERAYYHKHNDYIYVFYFNAKIDISDLEEAFLYYVYYE